MCHTLKHTTATETAHLYMCVFCLREQFLEYEHMTSRWVLHALAEWCVCVLEQVSLFLCHHEYVTKLPLRKDDL